jgi:HTH-type transcriptional regulator, competence development regulator
MITEIGKMLRKERIDRDMTLYDLASALNISPAYLSHIEMGRRPASTEILDKICKALGYHDVKAQRLKKAAENSYNAATIKFATKNLNEGDRDLLRMFARRFSDLDQERKEQLFQLLDEGEDDE